MFVQDFRTGEDAAAAYDKAARQLGRPVNFPTQGLNEEKATQLNSPRTQVDLEEANRGIKAGWSVGGLMTFVPNLESAGRHRTHGQTMGKAISASQEKEVRGAKPGKFAARQFGAPSDNPAHNKARGVSHAPRPLPRGHRGAVNVGDVDVIVRR